MELKEHMNLLLREQRRIEATIEADIQTYAKLCVEEEERRNAYENKRLMLQKLRAFFVNFAKEGEFSKDSVYVKKCKSELEECRQKYDEVEQKIAEKENYYRGLKNSDYYRLASLGTEEASLASVMFAYASKGMVDSDAKRLDIAKHIIGAVPTEAYKEKVITYLLIKYLVYCEQNGYGEAKKSEERDFYNDLMNRYCDEKNDSIWTSIVPVYLNYEMQLVLQRCLEYKAEIKNQSEKIFFLVEHFDNTCDMVERELKQFFPFFKGVKDLLGEIRVKKDYRREYLRTERKLHELESNNRRLQKGFELLYKIENELRGKMESCVTRKEIEEYSRRLDEVDCVQVSMLDIENGKNFIDDIASSFRYEIREITDARA